MRRTRDESDYYLGGRSLGPWLAALSSAASSSSAWTLLGVSGAAWRHGLGAVWILPACAGGFLLNWWWVARPLQEASRRSGAVTLTDFLAGGLPPRAARVFTWSASIIVLVSLGTYVASQFQGAGKTFAEIFHLRPAEAVLTGGGVVFLYTLAGGFWAVSATDALQGLVMAAAALILPLGALHAAGGPAGILHGLADQDPRLLDPFRGLAPAAALGMVLGTLGIGLGYPGQPHVVNRFMAMRDERAFRHGRRIAMAWALILYSGMLVAGWGGRVLFPPDVLADQETVLLRLAGALFPPALAGVLVAAVLSAVMSTADSQLLVCGSTVSHDLLPGGGGRRALRRGRVAVLVLGLLALVAALLVRATIFTSVLSAWSALGAAFGPLLLLRLRGRRLQPWGALASLWGGFLLSWLWFAGRQHGAAWTGDLYELVPAFALALVLALLGSRPATSLLPVDRPG